jgi:hypothetical protein
LKNDKIQINKIMMQMLSNDLSCHIRRSMAVADPEISNGRRGPLKGGGVHP